MRCVNGSLVVCDGSACTTFLSWVCVTCNSGPPQEPHAQLTIDGKVVSFPVLGGLHLIPYEGTIDWRSFYQALERVDYPGVLMYEIIHRPNIDQVLKQVTESYAHMSSRVA